MTPHKTHNKIKGVIARSPSGSAPGGDEAISRPQVLEPPSAAPIKKDRCEIASSQPTRGPRFVPRNDSCR
jgi:hypothetical protein